MEDRESVHNDVDLAYLAGFFDGEGSINVYAQSHYSGYGTFSLRLNIQIEQVHRGVLESFQTRFGGALYQKKRQKDSHREIFLYQIAAQKAKPLLEALLPYLRQKKEIARLALQMLGIDLRGGNALEIAERERLSVKEKEKWTCAREISDLNMRGGNKPNRVQVEYESRYGTA